MKKIAVFVFAFTALAVPAVAQQQPSPSEIIALQIGNLTISSANLTSQVAGLQAQLDTANKRAADAEAKLKESLAQACVTSPATTAVPPPQ